MKHKLNDLSVAAAFAGLLLAVLIFNLLKSPAELSYSERRRLARFPAPSVASVMNGAFMEGFDDYAVDQIAFRDPFRQLKAVFDLGVLRKSDNNAIFVVGDQVFKTEYPLHENSVTRLCGILNYVDARYLDGMNVHYAIVPDKNYYLEHTRHLKLDYPAMADLVRANLNETIRPIDLFGALSLDSYYLTDAHWRQEKLGGVVSALSEGLGADMELDLGAYEANSYFPFYGVYFGQSALAVTPDELIYLVSETTEKAVVTSIEAPGELAVYNTDELGGMDSYNLFMLGPAAIVTARNPEGGSGRELVIFRDSYASSLTPLLLDGYDAVTLVDLRYIRPDLVGDFVEFAGQDVLFLYSSTLFNNSDSMKSPPAEDFTSPFTTRFRNR